MNSINMKFKIPFLHLFTILLINLSFSQITINNSLYTPSQLVNGVLVPSGS